MPRTATDTPALAAVPKAADEFALFPLDDVTPSQFNPRTRVDVDPDLVASIKRHGLIEPIVVRPDGDLISGARRLAAWKVARPGEQIPSVVRDVTDAQAEEMRLVENLHRLDLTPMEEARAFQSLIDRHGHTQKSVAAAVARNQGHVSKRLQLLKLDDDLADLVDAGRLPIAEAVTLARLPQMVRDTVATDIARGLDPAQSVEAAARSVARLKERAEALKELRARKPKVTVLDVAAGDTAPTWSDGNPVTHLTAGMAADHRKACKSAVFVVGAEPNYQGSWVTEWCLDVDKHRNAVNAVPVRTEATAAEAARREAHDAHRAAVHAAAARRTAHAATLVTGALPKSHPDHVAMWWLNVAVEREETYLTLDDAADLIHGPDTVTADEVATLIRETSTANDRNRWMLALVLSDGEAYTDQLWDDITVDPRPSNIPNPLESVWSADHTSIRLAARHLAYLASTGLELDATEQAIVDWREPAPVVDTDLPESDDA